MASIRVREKTGKLFLDFRVQGQRCREQTALDDTPANRRKLEVVLKKIEAEITLLTFNYAQYFPASANAKKFERSLSAETPTDAGTPLFEQFGELWLTEMQIQWRKSHSYTVAATLKNYLYPWFGAKEVSSITKADILEFRSSLAKVTSRAVAADRKLTQ